MKIKKITALILALIMILSVFGCGKKEKDDDEIKTVGSAPAVWSESTVVTEEMFVYYFNGYYRYFLETYSDDLSALGLDPSKSLSSQRQSDEYTWQEYMTVLVYRQLREMIALADSAKAAGMKLDDSDKEKIANQIAAYDELAAQAGMAVGDYIEKTYGKGVTKEVMESAISLRFLANKYYEKLWAGYNYTDEECLAYYEEHRNSFIHYDCLQITVPAADVATLTATTDEESFLAAVRSVITKNNFSSDYNRFADTIEKQVAKKRIIRCDYDPNTSLGKWVVEDERQPYDIHTKTESTGNVTVTMVLPTSDPGAINGVIYRDDLPLKNIKYMVFADGDGFDGVTKAENIMNNWKEDPTVERFDELAKKYNGGDATGVTRGMFNPQVNDWVFSEERKTGDCDIVSTEGGAYIIYMLEDGEPSWLSDVRAEMKENAYNADVNKAIDKYPTEYDGDIVYNVVEVQVVDPQTTDTTAAAE